MIAYVEAPNSQLYLLWLAKHRLEAKRFPLVKKEADLLNYHGPIYVLNGGSMDPHIRAYVNRYKRAQVEYREV